MTKAQRVAKRIADKLSLLTADELMIAEIIEREYPAGGTDAMVRPVGGITATMSPPLHINAPRPAGAPPEITT